jgi:hypothetical protein
MKPRTLQTFKILAVAAATAGCTRTVGAEVGAEPAKPSVEAAAPLPPPDPQARADRPIPPLPPGPAGVALLDLSRQVHDAGPEKAREQAAHFRPLCDKDGYPLVGNLMSKSGEQTYGPEEFCAEARRTAQR